ncbi:MAG: c-type cytochrome [Thiotrichales bacterium]|nr:MAG: c-type cytochrome [Thiotrichales bacterium]
MRNHRFLALVLIAAGMIESSFVIAEEAVKEEEKPTEFEQALSLTPNIENGRELYKLCVACHGPEGWGDSNGSYPQIAGQLPGVTIKQLADIRAGNRDNPIMRAFSSRRSLGDAQAIADVAGYIASLPMTEFNGQGSRRYIELGREIYERDCADCHGESGEGDVKKHVPAIHGQHYEYLERQYRWIRNGRRRNANKDMVEQIQGYSLRDEKAVLSYTASLIPPGEKLADPDWKNPDFPNYERTWRPEPTRDRR